MKKISAIICAYNEADTIQDVVTKVCDYFFDEVVVVNDGSTDKTDSILKEINDFHNFKYIALPENKGKGYAMATGIENASCEIIVFIDADLSNLKEEHFAQLITPVFNKEANMVLGQATETLINYKINPFKSFTGERALLKKDILPILEDIKSSNFGVETLINLYYQAQEKKVKYVMLAGLIHPTKFEKTTQLKALTEYFIEAHQIALIAFNNYKYVSKIVRNNLNKQ
ncbi:MAG: glycosyltransferase family 2 protein [Bacteroidales bacterium]|jgi:glycosyltransferase involved in cell wall biosynthesis